MEQESGLYRQQYEHDACGIGAIISIRGERTRRTVDDALKIVEKLEYRAGKDATGKIGDGVGLMLQVPHRLFLRTMAEQGVALGEERDYGVGMFFFPQNTLLRSRAKKMFEIICQKEGLDFLGWRQVPVAPEVLGDRARDGMPAILQCFIRRPAETERGLDFDRQLYIVRREFEQSNDQTYVCSLSSRTIVYKGMFLVSQRAGSIPICRARTAPPPWLWFTPVSPPTPPPPGSGPTPIG